MKNSTILACAANMVNAISKMYDVYKTKGNGYYIENPELNLEFSVNSHKTAVARANEYVKVSRLFKDVWQFNWAGSDVKDEAIRKEFWNTYEWYRKEFNNDFDLTQKLFNMLVDLRKHCDNTAAWTWIFDPKVTGDTDNRYVNNCPEDKAVFVEFRFGKMHIYYAITIKFETRTNTPRQQKFDEMLKLVDVVAKHYGTISTIPVYMPDKCWVYDAMTEKKIDEYIAKLNNSMTVEIPLCSEKQAMYIAKNAKIDIESAKKLNKYQAKEILDYYFHSYGGDEEFKKNYIDKVFKNI